MGPLKNPLQINFEGVFYVSENLKKVICKKLAKKIDDKVKEFAKGKYPEIRKIRILGSNPNSELFNLYCI